MGKVICLANQKGGVGKTTSTNAIAMVLKHKGYKVLCIDFDPQGNLTFSMDAEGDESQPTIYDVLKRSVKCRYAIRHTELTDIIPSDLLLSGVEMEFTGKGREFILRDSIVPLKTMYDFILIDSPPELGVLTVNAFASADSILIPATTDVYSLQGVTRLYDAIDHIRRTLNTNLKIDGIFLVRFNPREEMSRIVLETAQMIGDSLGIPVFKAQIHNSVAVAKSQALQRDMVKYSPRNQAVLDYIKLVDELLERGL